MGRGVVVLGVFGVLAAGCGGAEKTFTPTGDTAGPNAAVGRATPTVSGAAPSAGGTPRSSPASADALAFPADLKVVYQPRVVTAGGAAAVRAFGVFWKAWWYAVATGGDDVTYRKYVAPGSALGGTGLFSDVVESWANEKVRPTGTIRAYGVRVLSVNDKGEVSLVGCGDESKTGTKNLNTGAVSWAFGKLPTSRYKIRIVMARNGGVWQVHDYQPVPVTDPAGRECRG